jgi:hypothetical protein
VIRLLLSLSALAPLLGIIAIRLASASPMWAVALGVVAVLLALFLPLILAARRSVEPRPINVASVRDESSQVPAYLVTYVFPFAFATVDGIEVVLAYAVFGLLLIVLLVRTDLGMVNPVLLAVGLHSYAVVTASGRALTVIAPKAPLPGSRILAHPVAGATYHFRSIIEGDLDGQ